MEMLVKIAVMMMAPGGVLAPPEARGREPPFLFFFLDLLPRWEKGFPSGPRLPWRGRGESPSEIGSISLFLRSGILPWHRFLYIWRSVTPIGLPRPFSKNYLSCGQRRASTALRVAHESPGCTQGGREGTPPCLVATSGTVSR